MTSKPQSADQDAATRSEGDDLVRPLPKKLPAPGIQHLIIGPRLPWIDESKMDGYRPEKILEKARR